MTLRRIRPQWARDEEEGWDVHSVDRPKSIFNRIELPALRQGLADGRVTSITIHHLDTGEIELMTPPAPSLAPQVLTAVGGTSTAAATTNEVTR